MSKETYSEVLSREHRAKKRLFFWLKNYDIETDPLFDDLFFDFKGSRFVISVKEMFRYKEVSE